MGNPSFLKIFLDADEEKCEVPPSCIKYLDEDYPRRCYIKGPTGGCWQVTLTKGKKGKFFFGVGCDWEAFVHGNSINSGDSLLFTYCGDSQFKVKVYDKMGSEKDNFFKKKEALENSKCNKVKIANSGVSSGKGNKRAANSKKRKTMSSVCAKGEITMKASYINRIPPYCLIPPSLAKAIINPRENVRLVSDGASWFVQYDQNQNRLKRGWGAFVTAKNLEVGDVCVFEAVGDRDNTFTVTIDRKQDDNKD